MKRFLVFLLALLPGAAMAHPGHLAEVAGHDHIIAGIAIGVAIGVAVWGALKGKRDDEASQQADEAAEDGELQEA